MNERVELYRAVKHQVNEYQADHGYTLTEMWKLVNQNTKRGNFWKGICLTDYREDRRSV